MTNPLYEAATQGIKAYSRTRNGYTPQAPSQPVAADEPTQPPEQPEQSMMGYVGSKALSGIAAAGNLLDLPGSSVRDVLAGKNPFDQWADPLGYEADKNRTEGRELARQWGAAGKKDTWGNFIGGLALEFALDPTTYVGVGVLSKSGKALSAAGIQKTDGIMQHLAKSGKLSASGKKSAVRMRRGGGVGRQMRLSADDVFTAMDEITQKAIKEAVGDGSEFAKKLPGGETIEKLKVDSKVLDLNDFEKLTPDANTLYIVDSDDGLKVFRGNNQINKATAKLQNAYNKEFGKLGTGSKTVKTAGMLRKDYDLFYKKRYGEDLTGEYTKKELRSRVQIGIPGSARLKKDLFQEKDLDAAKDRWFQRNAIDEDEIAAAAPKGGDDAAGGASGSGGGTPPSGDTFAKELMEENAHLAGQVGRLSKEAADVFGEDEADAWLPGLVKYAKRRFKDQGEQEQFLSNISLEQITPEQAVEFAARMKGGSNESIDDLAQAAFQKQAGVSKGFVEFGQDGKTIIRGVKGAADMSTLMHETGHIFRRHLDKKLLGKAEQEVEALLKDPERLRVAAPDIDVKDAKLLDENGKWTREAEEVFARLYERYATDGLAPKGLKAAFEKIRDMMLAAYKTIIGSKGADEIAGGEVPEGLRKVFDRMLTVPKRRAKKAAKPKATAPPVSPAATAAKKVDDELGAAADDALDAMDAEEQLAGQAGGLMPSTNGVVDVPSQDSVLSPANTSLATRAASRADETIEAAVSGIPEHQIDGVRGHLEDLRATADEVEAKVAPEAYESIEALNESVEAGLITRDEGMALGFKHLASDDVRQRIAQHFAAKLDQAPAPPKGLPAPNPIKEQAKAYSHVEPRETSVKPGARKELTDDEFVYQNLPTQWQDKVGRAIDRDVRAGMTGAEALNSVTSKLAGNLARAARFKDAEPAAIEEMVKRALISDQEIANASKSVPLSKEQLAKEASEDAVRTAKDTPLAELTDEQRKVWEDSQDALARLQGRAQEKLAGKAVRDANMRKREQTPTKSEEDYVSEGVHRHFLNMIKKNFDPENPGEFGKFLNSQAAIDSVVNYAKRKKVRGGKQAVPQSVIAKIGTDQEQSAVAEMVARQDNIADHVTIHKEMDDIAEEAGGTTARNIDWLKQHEIEGKSQTQIAKENGVSQPAVNKALRDAKAIVKEKSEIFEQAGRQPIDQQIEKIKVRREMGRAFNAIRSHFEGIVSDPTSSQRMAAAFEGGGSIINALPGVTRMTALFDASVFGAQTEKGQEISRLRWEATQQATNEVRQLIASSVKDISETGELDVLKTMDLSGISKDEATKLVNDRNAEIVRFMEMRHKKGNKLDRSKFNDEKTAQLIENQLHVFGEILDDRLVKEMDAGLKISELVDDFVTYFPRIQHRPNKPLVKSAIGEAVINGDIDAAKARNIKLKNIVGGRQVLDELSVDREISGKLWNYKDGKVHPNVSDDAGRAAALKHVQDNYIEKILTKEEIDALKDAADSPIAQRAQEKLEGVTDWAFSLDPAHAMDQMPYYGRNFLYDFAHRVSEGIAKSGVSMAGLDLIAHSVKREGEIGTEVWKVLQDAKLDTNQAFTRIIKAKGDEEAYRVWREAKIEKLKDDVSQLEDKSLELGHLHLRQVGDEFYIHGDELKGASDDAFKNRKAATDAEIEQAKNLAKEYTKTKPDAYQVDATTTEEMKRIMKSWTTPPETKDLNKFLRTALNIFKYNVTVTHPAFHVRNLLSGQIQNFFYGAYGKTGVVEGARAISTAFKLRQSGDASGIADYLGKEVVERNRSELRPREGSSNTSDDHMVSNWVREQAFKYGIIGDKQGYAVEDVGEALSGLASQYPGGSPNPHFFGTFRGIRKPETGVVGHMNPLHARGNYAPQKVVKSNGEEVTEWVKIEETAFAPGRVGEDLSIAVEDLNRIAPFLAFIKQGYSPDEAARLVHKIQIDYSQLSEFEKGIRQFIPFYTFTSRMVPLTYKDLVTNPGGKQAWAIRTSNRMQDPEANAPDYLQKGTAIPIGQSPDGGDRYISGLGLAYEDSLSFLPLLGGDFKGTAGELFSRSRPEIQGAAELAFGRSAFFDRPLEDLDPPVGRLISNLSGAERDGNAEPFISHGVEFALSKSPIARYAGSLNKLLDERKNPLYRALNTFSGIKVTDVSPDAQNRVALDRAVSAQKELGAREASFVYMPEWRKKRLSPEQLESYEGLQEFVRQVNKETRERKKATESLKQDNLQNSEET